MDAASIDEEVIHLTAAAQKGVRQAPYAAEVKLAMRDGSEPNVYLFAGPRCWDRATTRRIQFGAGTALVLPADVLPGQLVWPALDAVIVAWPAHDNHSFGLKLGLAQALIRDGVRYVAIEHEPDWIQAWREGARRRGFYAPFPSGPGVQSRFSPKPNSTASLRKCFVGPGSDWA
jgi:hypothetical protein